MKLRWRVAVVLAVTTICSSNAYAQLALPNFGVFAGGSDLEPVSASLSDGGPGATSAGVTFTTFQADARFDPASAYLPILRAESEGVDATFDDDRTQAAAEGFEVFASSAAQTIRLEISLSSAVTNAPGGTSSVLANIYVIGGPGFFVSDTFCSPGQRTVGGIYLCGARIAQSSRNPGLNFSNLSNGGSDPLILDTLTFTVGSGETFGIVADLSAGSFMGTADAFNTLSMGFEDDQFIAPVTTPAPPPSVPTLHPIALHTLVPAALVALGLVAMRRTSVV